MTTLNIVQVSLQFLCATLLVFLIVDMRIRQKIRKDKSSRLLYMLQLLCLLLVADSLAYIFRGNVTRTGFYMVRICNFLVFFFEYLLHMCLVYYLAAMVEERGGKVSPVFFRIVYMLSLLGLLFLISTQFNGFYYTFNSSNEYVRSNGFIVSFIIHFTIIAIEIVIVACYRKCIGKWNMMIAGSFFIALILAGVVQIFWYGISFTNISMTFSIMIMYICDSMDRLNEEIVHLQQLVDEQKKSEEMRRRILLSSIQPHFLFNSLNAIESLITIDPDLALKAMGDISQFLRASTDTLNSDDLVTISEEIDIVKHYLSLIEMRFWGNVVVEIKEPDEDVNYLIPPFTLQPLAENAINHGIRKNKNGCGKLVIQCIEEEAWHLIRVIDDGVGFSMSALTQEYDLEEQHVHVGITMVRERLEIMCGGSLVVKSQPGLGTTCEIRIPR